RDSLAVKLGSFEATEGDPGDKELSAAYRKSPRRKRKSSAHGLSISPRPLPLKPASGTLATVEVLMRSRLLLLTLVFYIIFSLGCTSKPATDSSGNANPNTNGTSDNSAPDNEGDNRSSKKGCKE